MTLEDFEKSLAESRGREQGESHRDSKRSHREHRHHHHRSHHRDDDRDRDGTGHRHKRRRYSLEQERDEDEHEKMRHKHRHRHERDRSRSPDEISRGEAKGASDAPAEPKQELKRDSWMEAPLDVEYVKKRRDPTPDPVTANSRKAEFELKIHEKELNKHFLQEQRDQGPNEKEDLEDVTAQHEVDYVFGDSGSQWRMTRLRGVYRQAEETGQTHEEIAMKLYGDLRAFDDAREEEIELDRRKTYGEGYVGKEKPSGELFQERTLDQDIHQEAVPRDAQRPAEAQIRPVEAAPAASATVMDQTALNRLKAKMMKAKLRGGPDAAKLEEEYNATAAAFVPGQQPEVVVLGAMESRELAGGSRGEVRNLDTKRGRERGTVVANDDMSVDDMVREERRTRGQAGGEGRRFAERIAKDGRFNNDLEYMDDNANKLAQRVHKSKIDLKNVALADYHRVTRILDTCPLCYHEDRGSPPVAPVVALGTRTYLTLPPEPEIAPGGACIVPIQHRKNLLECDDDEWEEIRNFMKALTRAYHARGQLPIFYENAARPRAYAHALLIAAPLPAVIHATAPGFFHEAILAAAPEWAQHRKLIDTVAAARERGHGRGAFRRSLAKEMPYFHVWFELDGGLGHVVEDEGGEDGNGDGEDDVGGGGGGGSWRKWPKGDRFAREVLGGMLGVETMGRMRREGRWGETGGREGRERMDKWKKRWEWPQWDWTKALVQGDGA